MNRFSIFEIPSAKNHTTTWEEYVEKYAKGYEPVGVYGNDQDYLLIDHQEKMYSWAEHGDISEDADQEELSIFFPMRISFEDFFVFQKAQLALMENDHEGTHKFANKKFSISEWESIKNQYAKSYFE